MHFCDRSQNLLHFDYNHIFVQGGPLTYDLPVQAIDGASGHSCTPNKKKPSCMRCKGPDSGLSLNGGSAGYGTLWVNRW